MIRQKGQHTSIFLVFEGEKAGAFPFILAVLASTTALQEE